MIDELDQTDPDSTAFKYAVDKDGNSTLPKNQDVDLTELKRKVSDMLDDLIAGVDYLYQMRIDSS